MHEQQNRPETIPVIPIGHRTLRDRAGWGRPLSWRGRLIGGVAVGVVGFGIGTIYSLAIDHAQAVRDAAQEQAVPVVDPGANPADPFGLPSAAASPAPVQLAPTLPAIARTAPAVAPTIAPTAAPAEDTTGPAGHWAADTFEPGYVGAPITADQAKQLDPLWAVYSLSDGEQIGLRVGERVVFVHTAAEGHAAREDNPLAMTAIVQIPADIQLPEPIQAVSR
jgi:hypothetical protein